MANQSKPPARNRTNSDWRKKVFDIIEPLSKNHKSSKYYDWMMIAVTLISFIPLVFHNENIWPLAAINILCVIIFAVDYTARFITANYHYKNNSLWSFARYPFSPLAIIDLIVILSIITSINSGLRLLRVARLLHVVRIFQHSKSLRVIRIVLKRATRPLLFVASLASIYIFMVAAIMFNEEPELFPTFLDALYFAVVSMSTIGFGDIVPQTEVGRIITMISAIAGVAVFALPTSVITAEYVAVVNEYREGKIDGKHHPRRFEVDETELIADAMKDSR
ncbi:potassium channel family protein [Candidatus Saccharibacteria bacterium]|nr:potassium channel family protein [Candidatus Saccharibacteria bacterium]